MLFVTFVVMSAKTFQVQVRVLLAAVESSHRSISLANVAANSNYAAFEFHDVAVVSVSRLDYVL